MKYPAICEATTKEQMQAYFEQHLKDCAEKFGGTPESHRAVQLSNVGYFSGYYSSETAKRVHDWLGATHPIFGASHADGTLKPEEALARGLALGRAESTKNATASAEGDSYGRVDFSIEEYIAGLQWSPQATEHEKTLVVGNLRAMFAVVRERHNNYARAARDVAAGFKSYDDEARSRQSATTDSTREAALKEAFYACNDVAISYFRQGNRRSGQIAEECQEAVRRLMSVASTRTKEG